MAYSSFYSLGEKSPRSAPDDCVSRGPLYASACRTMNTRTDSHLHVEPRLSAFDTTDESHQCFRPVLGSGDLTMLSSPRFFREDGYGSFIQQHLKGQRRILKVAQVGGSTMFSSSPTSTLGDPSLSSMLLPLLSLPDASSAKPCVLSTKLR